MPSIKQVKPFWLSLCVALLISGCTSLPSTSEKPGGDADKSVNSVLQRSYEEALLSLRQGDLEAAMRQFQRLAKANPRLAGPMTNIGIIHLKQNDPGAAEQAFREALARNPESAPAHNQLGVALRLQGRFQEAAQAYQQALELEPVYLLAHRNLGILYDLYLADPAKALQQYRLYQKLAEAPNQEIEGWIMDLERRVGDGK
ncbi:MAG: tetratricopeptide repeat protein [Chromatiales bacterium]|jgi:Flp pilus assembly protein TadD